jgi:hypothetical protein
MPASAQYPGKTTTPDKDSLHLRAVAVLEWTGEQDHPKSSRLVPVSVFDGQDLEDAGVYMARPEPLALEGEVEYQLQQDGKPIGLFDVQSSGRQLGSWFGSGNWKPLPAAKQAPAQAAKIDEDDVQSDVPILHRKHPSGDSGSGSGKDAGSAPSGPPPDPDRPTLHKSGDASGSSSGSGSPNSSSGPPPDPDRPTLHKNGDNASAGTTANNPSQAKPKKNAEEEGSVESVAQLTEPDRPIIKRGKAEGYNSPVLPSVMGMPADMKQIVAVSDPKGGPVHPWDYTWANPDDETKMKAAMEDIARTALGLSAPQPAAKPAPKTAAAHKTAKPAPPPEPAPLADEQFRVFELAYGSGATMVLSARTPEASGPVKFVTLIAQPDLYGNVAVLVKSVADAAHLDDNPRMRLIDAVDAMADNRGELLFELRGATQRQFALYRVLRGQATRIFLSGGEAIGSPTGE